MRPTLLLDPAHTGRTDPRLTATRASTASYYDANGVMKTAAANELRITHDPLTGECLGWLIEAEARTNLLTYGEQIDHANWASKGLVTVTPNAATALDGALTADKIVETAAAGQHFVAQTVAVAESTQYVGTVYVKAAERTRCSLVVGGADWAVSASLNFNLATGSIVSGGGTYGFDSLGDGWYRLWVVGTTGATDVPRGLLIQLANDAGLLSYTGDGTSGLYIWRAKLEAGASPSSDIPATSAAVTRAADVVSMTGGNFSDWYNQAEGTLVARIIPSSLAVAARPVAILGATDVDRMAFVINTNGSVNFFLNTVAGASQVSITSAAGVAVPGVPLLVAFAYKDNLFRASVNGVTVTEDTELTLPTMTRMTLGSQNGTNPANCPIPRVAYYAKALSQAELNALTTR